MREVPQVVWVLAIGRFFSSLASFLMLFLTLYLTGPRELAPVTAGLVAGGYGVGMLAGNLTGGRWGDHLGHRRVLLVASTISGLGVAAVPWLPLAVVVPLLPVVAYLAAAAGVSVGALNALAVPRGDRRTAVAIGRAASNAGFVLGPPLGALVVSQSYEALFVIDGLMTLAVRFAVAPFLPPGEVRGTREESGVGTQQEQGLWASLRLDRSLQVLLVAVVAVDVVYRQLYTTVPLHLRDEGQPVALYTAVIAIGSGLILLLEVPVAVALRERAAPLVIAVGYGLVGLGMLGFGLPEWALTAIGAMVVLTAGEILYKTTATAHVLDAAPDHLVGQYQGLYTAAATSGTMLAAPIGGAVYATAPALLWPGCALVCAVAAGLVTLSARPARWVRSARRSPAGSR